MAAEIPAEYQGWWRIVETGTWVDDGLDILGPALLSLTGSDDRLRMHCLLAHVKARGTRAGVSFTWKGAWEFDPMSGTGKVTLDGDDRLQGFFRIRNGDDSTFVAERAERRTGRSRSRRPTATSGGAAGRSVSAARSAPRVSRAARRPGG